MPAPLQAVGQLQAVCAPPATGSGSARPRHRWRGIRSACAQVRRQAVNCGKRRGMSSKRPAITSKRRFGSRAQAASALSTAPSSSGQASKSASTKQSSRARSRAASDSAVRTAAVKSLRPSIRALAGGSIGSITLSSGGVQPAASQPIIEQIAGFAAELAQALRIETAQVGQTVHQARVAPAGPQRLAVDEDVACVVGHARAPVEHHAQPTRAPSRRDGEPRTRPAASVR